jgi:hypothetical protein
VRRVEKAKKIEIGKGKEGGIGKWKRDGWKKKREKNLLQRSLTVPSLSVRFRSLITEKLCDLSSPLNTTAASNMGICLTSLFALRPAEATVLRHTTRFMVAPPSLSKVNGHAVLASAMHYQQTHLFALSLDFTI